MVPMILVTGTAPFCRDNINLIKIYRAQAKSKIKNCSDSLFSLGGQHASSDSCIISMLEKRRKRISWNQRTGGIDCVWLKQTVFHSQ